MKRAEVPTLWVGGTWDAEDILGPQLTYRRAGEGRQRSHWNRIVLGPWAHNQWNRPGGDSLGPIQLRQQHRRLVSGECAAPLVRLVPAREGRWDVPRGLGLRGRGEPVAHLRRLAAEGRPAAEALPARRRQALVRPARRPGRGSTPPIYPTRRTRFPTSRAPMTTAAGIPGWCRASASSTIAPTSPPGCRSRWRKT